MSAWLRGFLALNANRWGRNHVEDEPDESIVSPSLTSSLLHVGHADEDLPAEVVRELVAADDHDAVAGRQPAHLLGVHNGLRGGGDLVQL
jgi:hypothetical protein